MPGGPRRFTAELAEYPEKTQRNPFHLCVSSASSASSAANLGIRHPPSAIRNGHGFSLLEVLVATAILGFVVAAVMGGMSGSLRNLARAEGYEKAVLVARAELNRLLAEERLRPGRFEGRWDQDYRWEAVVERWNPRSPNPAASGVTLPPVLLVRFTVFWKGEGAEKSATFETSRYRSEL